MKKHLLFDLDGTLTDSAEGITNSVLYALEKYGIQETNRDKLRKFIGPPLKESFMSYYGFMEEKAEEAVEKYREYFKVKGLFENRIYEGIPEMLTKLQAAGKQLYVATSKPEIFAKQIMEHFEIDKYFVDIHGSTLDGSRGSKTDVIAYALEQNEIQDKAETIMIGDRKHDIIGGQECGIETIGVLYGFGSIDELKANKADYIAETVKDLEQMLLCDKV